MKTYRFIFALLFTSIGFVGCKDYGVAQSDKIKIVSERWQGNPMWALAVTINFKKSEGEILGADGNVDFNTGGAYFPPRHITNIRMRRFENAEVEIELLFENSPSAYLNGRFVADNRFEGRYQDERLGELPIILLRLLRKN